MITARAGQQHRRPVHFLQAVPQHRSVAFEELEDILGSTLPPSARNHLPYWYSTHNALGKAIAAGEFKASGVNLTAERVGLRRR
jgi:hypothetical protein